MQLNGGPVFPLTEEQLKEFNHYNHHNKGCGITVRQWYAGLALQGLLSNEVPRSEEVFYRLAAKAAFEHADAMIKQGME